MPSLLNANPVVSQFSHIELGPRSWIAAPFRSTRFVPSTRRAPYSDTGGSTSSTSGGSTEPVVDVPVVPVDVDVVLLGAVVLPVVEVVGASSSVPLSLEPSPSAITSAPT